MSDHQPADAGKPATRHVPEQAKPATRHVPEQAKPATRHVPDQSKPATQHVSASPGDAGTPTARVPTRRLRLPDAVLDRYSYDEDLSSSGAQADIVLCTDLTSGERKAVKVYRPGAEPLDLDTFTKLQGADEDHVVPFVLEQDESAVWEVQEFFPLGSLHDVVARRGGGAQPDWFVREVLREVGLALDHIHRQDIAHRDLKPQNILIRRTGPLDCVLADFGLARANVLSNAIGSIAGTYTYTSFEGSYGRAPKANDWWGLGVICHELLTGRHLFSAVEPGSYLSEARVLAAFAEHTWTYEDVTDQRWRLLLDGLLAEADHRWRWSQVEAWLSGDSPKVTVRRQARSARRRPFQFAGTAHATPVALAAAIRKDFDLACDLVAGIKVSELASWLHTTEVGTDADECLQRARSGHVLPPRTVVELQLVFDPGSAPVFKDREVSDESLGLAVSAGDDATVRWIHDLRDMAILSLVGQYTESPAYSRADELIRSWWNTFGARVRAPGWAGAGLDRFATVTSPAAMGILLGAALDPAYRDQVVATGTTAMKEIGSTAPQPLRDLRPDTVQGVPDAVLATLAATPWAAERARAAEQQRRESEAEAARRAAEAAAAAAAERRRRNQLRFGGRRRTDRRILVVGMLLSLTVVVPWALGRLVLRDWAIHPTGAGVYDVSIRDTTAYFLADWSGGCVVVLGLTALLIVLRPWRGRPVTLGLGLALAVAVGVGLLPFSRAEWAHQELVTAARLRNSVYPFEAHHYSCGQATTTSGRRSTVLPGEPDVAYTLFASRSKANNSNECDQLELYEGYRPVKVLRLKKNQSIEPTGVPISVYYKFSGEPVFVVTLDSDKKLTYPLTKLGLSLPIR